MTPVCTEVLLAHLEGRAIPAGVSPSVVVMLDRWICERRVVDGSCHLMSRIKVILDGVNV